MNSVRRKIFVACILVVVILTATATFVFYWTDLWSPPLSNTNKEARVLKVLEDMSQSGGKRAGVPIEDGRALRLFAESVNARNVIEIGTSTGYSGLWLCLALQSTGGRLTTFEIDPDRAATARKHFQSAGVDHMVTIVEGDAHREISALNEPIDLVFIDADKDGYVDYLNRLLPLLRPGGLFLAHNIDRTAFLSGYVKAVSKNPQLETIFYQSGRGLAVTMKKR